MSYLKHQSKIIKSLCVISEFILNSIIITFLYANMCIVYNFHKCLNPFIIFLIFKSFFHYLFIIKYDFTLYSISKMLIFKKILFISINIRSIISFFKLNLHFVFKFFLIFFINVIIIILIPSLFMSAIISFFFINIFIIVNIIFFIKYNAHNNINFLIILINFLCLKYHLDKFLFNLYIRYSSS